MPVPTPISDQLHPARYGRFVLRSQVVALSLCIAFMFPALALAARPPQPATRVLLEPLGLQPISSRYLLAGSSMLTLHFVDDTHLLVTFAARRLIRRTPNDPPTDQDHNVDALLLELPSGRVLARTEWLLHDHGQYLWNLGHGQFMMRVRDTFTTFAPLANLKRGESFLQRPFLNSNRPVVAVILSSDTGLLTIETVDPIQEPLDPDSIAPPPPPRNSNVQLNLYRVDPPFDPAGRPLIRVAGRAIAARPTELPINPAGMLRVLDQGRGRWAFDFRTHTGKTSELALFDSTCRPQPIFVSPSEFLAFGCRGGGVRQQLGAFNLRGDEMWEQTLAGSYISPSFVYAPTAGRFAFGRLSMNSAAIATDTLVPAQLNGQFVDVYQIDSGKLLLHIDCTPIARAGQNFALAPDGMSLAVVREGAVEVYRLPELGPKDRTALQLAQSAAPPPVDGFLDLSPASESSARSVKGRKGQPQESSADSVAASDASTADEADPTLQLSAPAPAASSAPADNPQAKPATSQNSAAQAPVGPDASEPAKPRKPPTLYNPSAPDPNQPPH
ncbi:hypothetical protein BH10ACI4_BH10ACI4_14340 [soil metagenome]